MNDHHQSQLIVGSDHLLKRLYGQKRALAKIMLQTTVIKTETAMEILIICVNSFYLVLLSKIKNFDIRFCLVISGQIDLVVSMTILCFIFFLFIWSGHRLFKVFKSMHLIRYHFSTHAFSFF